MNGEGTQPADDLEALSDAIAARRADPRTPALVRRAFLSDGALTLRRYLALQEEDSPILTGAWPWEDAAGMAQAFCIAWEILFPDRDLPGTDKLSDGILQMVAEINRGFGAMMATRFPTAPGTPAAPSRKDGIGWIPRLIAEALSAGISQPIDLPLDRLFVLLASSRFNDGAECVGVDYRDRDLGGQLGEFRGTAVATNQNDQGTNHGGKSNQEEDDPNESLSDSSSAKVVDTRSNEADGGGNSSSTEAAHEETIA